jgi:Ni2+-binding GTPase involved in maturation of urease and hydrogenase
LEDTPKIQNQLMTVYSPLISAKLQRNALKTVVIGVCGGPSSGKIYFAEMLRLYLMRQKIETQVVKQEVYENQQFIELEDRFAWKEMLVHPIVISLGNPA